MLLACMSVSHTSCRMGLWLKRDAVGNLAPGLCPVSTASAGVLCARTASPALCPNDGETVLLGGK